MKKLIFLGLTILSCGLLHALPVGNPSEASLLCDGVFWEGSCCLDPCDPCTTWCDAVSFRIGYYGDFVHDRHLKIQDIDGGNFEQSKINTNAAYLAFNFWDRIDIFGTLGASDIYLKTNATDLVDGMGVGITGLIFITSETDFSWSVGARGTLIEWGCTTIGFEGQYFYTEPHIEKVAVWYGLTTWETVYPDNTINMRYREWQLGLGISHRINIAVPYAAVKWSKAQVKNGNAVFNDFPFTGMLTRVFDLENAKEWGYAVGISFVICEKGMLTVEGRWADETAVYGNAQFRF